MELAGVRASAGSSAPISRVISRLWRGALREDREEFREFAAAKFFMELGDFAGDTGRAVAENFSSVGDAFGDTMRSFVENDGAILDAQAFEGAAALAAAVGEKADEEEFFVGQAAGGQRSEKRGWSGDRYDGNVMAQAKRD